MKILVTGGLGFIGSYVAIEFLQQGHTVTTLDYTRPKDPSLFPSKGWDHRVGDIRNLSDCAAACQTMDVVIHSAAIASIARTIDHPLESSEINITGLLNMLKACTQASVKRFVFLSSAKIYGDIEQYPSSEKDIPCPATPYALTKLTGEYYCRYFSDQHGLESVCLRPFSVYGPRQNIQNGYVGNIIESICHDQSPRLPGTPNLSRDFTYIDDSTRACIQAATVPNVKFGIFNVGSGKTFSLAKVMELANHIVGKNIPASYVPIKPGTANVTLANLSQIKQVLGYEPQVSLEAGIHKTVQWYLSMKDKDPSLV
jgi:UDP-N-acetylglucosamine/UDP-N-acetylgalactosamine 4-epimerase